MGKEDIKNHKSFNPVDNIKLMFIPIETRAAKKVKVPVIKARPNPISTITIMVCINIALGKMKVSTIQAYHLGVCEEIKGIKEAPVVPSTAVPASISHFSQPACILSIPDISHINPR